jgi:hypothetical protein
MADDAQKVEVTTVSWVEVVEAHDSKRWSTPDPSYEFNNGRKFTDPKTQ